MTMFTKKKSKEDYLVTELGKIEPAYDEFDGDMFGALRRCVLRQHVEVLFIIIYLPFIEAAHSIFVLHSLPFVRTHITSRRQSQRDSSRRLTTTDPAK